MAAVCILLYECSFWNSLWLNMLSWIGMALLDFFIQTCVYLILCKLGGQRDILLSFSMERSGYLSIYTAIIILAGIQLLFPIICQLLLHQGFCASADLKHLLIFQCNLQMVNLNNMLNIYKRTLINKNEPILRGEDSVSDLL